MEKLDTFFMLTTLIIVCINGTPLGFIIFLESFGTLFGLMMYYFLSLFGLLCLSIIDEKHLQGYYRKLLVYENISLLFLPLYYQVVSVLILPKLIT